MKAFTRALMVLAMMLGLTAGLSPSSARADEPDPKWMWGSSFNCQQNISTTSECAFYVVVRLVGDTDEDGCIAQAQAPEYCAKIASDEKTWLWRPVITWEIAQAVLRGYERVAQDPELTTEFSKAFAESLLAAANARVATLFDPVTHEYLGVVSEFTSTQAPTISGTAKVGRTLTAKVNSDLWSPRMESRAWQWQRNGVDIAGATNYQYKLVAEDLNATITVALTGFRIGYVTTTRVSVATQPVALGSLSRGKVTVSGTRRVGKTLTAKTWGWTSGSTYHFQWYKSGIAIEGATAKTYIPLPIDRGRRLKVKVWTTKDGYAQSSSRTSPRTVKVRTGYITKVTPIISGNPIVGETLTVTPGAWKPLDAVLTYQWYRSGVKVTGQTGMTYVLTDLDRGKTIKVKVTARAFGYYTTSRYSHSTPVVTNPIVVTPPPTPTPSVTPTPSTTP